MAGEGEEDDPREKAQGLRGHSQEAGRSAGRPEVEEKRKAGEGKTEQMEKESRPPPQTGEEPRRQMGEAGRGGNGGR